MHGSFSNEEPANSAELKQAFFSDALLHKTTVKTQHLFHRNLQAVVIHIHQKEGTAVSLNFQESDRHHKYYSEIPMQLN